MESFDDEISVGLTSSWGWIGTSLEWSSNWKTLRRINTLDWIFNWSVFVFPFFPETNSSTLGSDQFYLFFVSLPIQTISPCWILEDWRLSCWFWMSCPKYYFIKHYLSSSISLVRSFIIFLKWSASIISTSVTFKLVTFKLLRWQKYGWTKWSKIILILRKICQRSWIFTF